jgi:endonuclease/exonuclease/phosphatase family metal-dependent hydrolase
MEPSPTHPYGDLLDTRLRLLTWNVWGRHGDWERRLEAIAQTLERAQPDLVVLQESWQTDARSQPEELAGRLGYVHTFARDRTDDGTEQGLAILSRWPIEWSTATELPLPEGEQPRNLVLAAQVTGPRGPVVVYGTHLAPYFHRGEVRTKQVRGLVEVVADHQPHPFPPVLCGDFNAPPEADEIRQLTGPGPVARDGFVFLDAWTMAGDGTPGHTVSHQNPNAAPLLIPDLTWDYVFVGWPSGANGAGHPVRAWLEGTDEIAGVVPSDHYALAVELRY